MNFRGAILKSILQVARPGVFSKLRLCEEYLKMGLDDKNKTQQQKIKEILLHSYHSVPYYKKVLAESRVIENDVVQLDRFSDIPFLTKEIIREQGSRLYSEKKQKGLYRNTSGGSTGEPVTLLQDDFYSEWNMVNKLYFFNPWLGKEIGEPNVNLWGSERDIYRNSLSVKERAANFFYNRTFLNAFSVNEEKLLHFIDVINKKKPASIWTYVESIDYLARYVEENNITIHRPKFIVSTAGTLYLEVKKKVETVFGCPVYNQYGSREVGFIGIECSEQNGLHVPFWSHFIEIIDGRVYVTLLTNFSMPLIRYEIGDLATVPKINTSCGHNNLEIGEVRGREISHFKTKAGIVHGQYFIHQFYFKNWVKQFQVIQEDYHKITCRIVLNDRVNLMEKRHVEDNIRLVMGKSCQIEWDFVDEIPKLTSGKFLYTISKL